MTALDDLGVSMKVQRYLKTHHPLSGNLRSTTVYFARVGDYVKVGVSSNVPRRLATLRSTIKPDDLPNEPAVLLGTMPGGPAAEFDAHCRLLDHNAVGEWFHATPECLALITDLLDPK